MSPIVVSVNTRRRKSREMNRNLPAFVRICFYNEMWLDVCLFLLLFQEEAHHFIVKSETVSSFV